VLRPAAPRCVTGHPERPAKRQLRAEQEVFQPSTTTPRPRPDPMSATHLA
jgi:hypothetical protein